VAAGLSSGAVGYLAGLPSGLGFLAIAAGVTWLIGKWLATRSLLEAAMASVR